jgi:hypothetical protein
MAIDSSCLEKVEKGKRLNGKCRLSYAFYMLWLREEGHALCYSIRYDMSTWVLLTEKEIWSGDEE